MLDPKKLKQLQAEFLTQYPEGFNDPEMIAIGKKHKMEKMTELARESFSKSACANTQAAAENIIKVISRSSMVSIFEKPKLRDFVNRLNDNDKAFLVDALCQLLHGKQQAGFESMVDILRTEKLAKWSLVTIIPAYYFPTKEVFVKPTTAKDIVRYFELHDLVYKPTPSWDFYRRYRKLINDGKKQVDKNLSPSNAAFSGFLMMSMKAA